jgi:REP element-mobilizing transposase RayT
MHIVWTTRDRQPIIEAALAEFLADNLAVIIRQERARLIELGIVSTHLHLLLRLHPTTELPRLIQRLKGGTAARANHHRLPGRRVLRWARGYNVDSVNHRALEIAGRYVRDQHLHHPHEAITGWPRHPSLGAGIESSSSLK